MSMYHPLVGKLDDLTLDDLLNKISDLHTKLGQSIRFGNEEELKKNQME